MISTAQRTRLKPIVQFREYPFGTPHDPSMREFMASAPWPDQDRVLDYLRSGWIVAILMAGSMIDWFDPGKHANPLINGEPLGGMIPLTDGTYFWPAGLIYFIEKYNVTVPQGFVDHAARNGWRIDVDAVSQGHYDFDY
jgi:hypothetical protein